VTKKLTNLQRSLGTITPALLVITGAFLIVIFGMLFTLSLQLDFSHRQVASEESLHVAEAGINYYKWHLAHDPNDFTDGTGQAGPYIHDYLDPQGASVGKYSIEVTQPLAGSSIVEIKSTGWDNDYQAVKRTIIAQYGQPSLAQYSFLSNASSWYGTGITVNGRVHSNNGIRMDGFNTSLVTSAKETYLCGSETGCSPAQSKPGVWGAGAGGAQGLWQFPVPAISFEALSFDFNLMRTDAIENGLHLDPSNAQGYHLLFSADGTVRINKVNTTDYYYAYASEDGCQRRYERVTSESLVGVYNVADEPIMFIEDHIWVEGTIRGRTTVVAARFPIDTYNTNVWIPNNIIYAAYDHSNSLGLIAQHDIYFTRNIPNNFRIDGALMAQGGHIIRHGYFSWCGGTADAVKSSLTILGSIISFNKSYWNFGSGPTSGFNTRTVSYDTDLTYSPPPFFPTGGEYEFISWREE